MEALFARGKRTVIAFLRVIGRAVDVKFPSDHQILNPARWYPRAVARRLLSHTGRAHRYRHR